MKPKKQSRRDELIKFLGKKSSYPYNPKTVKHIQTHASDVFIVPPYVYKVKKAVNLKFLDFSSLKKRKYFCEKEVELNRRLTRGIYLGVEKIYKHGNKLRFGSGDRIFEYAVKMKKMPEKYFIKNLLKKGKVGKKEFLTVIGTLVNFYRKQPVSSKVSKFGTAKIMKYTIDENSGLAQKFIGNTISQQCHDTINRYNKVFFKTKSGLFKKRVEDGYIKDCHGDLHLEHINLAPGELNIYDCIEFNDRFRYIDVASDIAFLSMDLDFNGYHDLSEFVISEFSKRIQDKTIHEIIDFYKSYRAYVRGKVESIRGSSGQVSLKERKLSVSRAKKYFRLALRYAVLGSKPTIIVVFGSLATGKSTVAVELSRELDAVVFSSDKVRKELAGVKLTERVYEGFSEGIYSKGMSERTYRELFNRCTAKIKEGAPVILDATFSKRLYRKEARDVAWKLGVNIVFIETCAGDRVIKRRLAEREISGRSISDGRLEIFTDFVKNYQEAKELPGNILIKINTGKKGKNPIDIIFRSMIDKILKDH